MVKYHIPLRGFTYSDLQLLHPCLLKFATIDVPEILVVSTIKGLKLLLTQILVNVATINP